MYADADGHNCKLILMSHFNFCLPEKRRGRTATLSIAAIVILVGIPLWWRTTETYRAWLPVSQIKDLANLQVSDKSFLQCILLYLSSLHDFEVGLFFQLKLSADVEVIFARGTVTPEQQKKVPLTRTQEEEHVFNGARSTTAHNVAPNVKTSS